MEQNRTFVGLDVHAWSVTGHALDAVTGEVWQRKLTPDPADILGWVSGMPGPVKVVYEAGPTGFGLARFLRWPRGGVCGGGAVEAAAAGRGSGQDRRPGRGAFGAGC